jgi:hypothetical protein
MRAAPGTFPAAEALSHTLGPLKDCDDIGRFNVGAYHRGIMAAGRALR